VEDILVPGSNIFYIIKSFCYLKLCFHFSQRSALWNKTVPKINRKSLPAFLLKNWSTIATYSTGRYIKIECTLSLFVSQHLQPCEIHKITRRLHLFLTLMKHIYFYTISYISFAIRCFQILFPMHYIFDISTGFIIDKFKRSSMRCRWCQALRMFFKPFFQIRSITRIKISIFHTSQDINIIHTISQGLRVLILLPFEFVILDRISQNPEILRSAHRYRPQNPWLSAIHSDPYVT